MSIFSLSDGLIMESDIVSLSKSLSIESDCLIDLSNGARHRFLVSSFSPLQCLVKPIQATEWIKEMYSNGITTVQISELIHFLNSIGALEIKRSYLSEIRSECNRLKFRIYGVKVMTRGRRSQSNLPGVSRAVIVAMIPVILLVLVASVFEYGAGFSEQIFIYGNAIFIVSLWMSTVLHEFVHVLFTDGSKFRPVVLQKGLRIGILHQPLSATKDIASALAGPLGGCSITIIIAIPLALFAHNFSLVMFALFVGVFHLLSWMPSYGDGQTLVKRIRRYYATTA